MTKKDDKISTIYANKLLEQVTKMKYENYRFVAMTCVCIDSQHYEVIYHFDKDYKMKNFKIVVSKEDKIPSVSEIYFCSLLAENEINELFGLNIVGIIVDYEGKMLITDDFANCAPMAGGQITVVKKGGTQNA